MKSGIYIITNWVNLKYYIGSSVDVGRRLFRHKNDLLKNKHDNSKLQRAWNKYGEESFTFEQVENCPEDSLVEREQFWLDDMRAVELGYNLSPTAESIRGIKRSEETKQKMSESMKNYFKNNPDKYVGKNNPNWGKNTSKEVKNKIANTLKKHYTNNVNPFKGKKHSLESRKKMSDKLSGENSPNWGRKHSEETKLKMKLAWIKRKNKNKGEK